jgi:hypothetical protein
MVVTEALGHGSPVIGTDVGGLPEALGHAPERAGRGLPGAPRRPVERWQWRCAPGSRTRPARSAEAGSAASGVPPCRPGRTPRRGSRACSRGWPDEPRGDRWWTLVLLQGGPAIVAFLVHRLGTASRSSRVRLVDRRVAGGCRRDRRADDRLLRLAVAPGRPGHRRRAADGAPRSRDVLPLRSS